MNAKRKEELGVKDKSIPCPICGGNGEVMNSNHYIADFTVGRRYEICRFCYGLGTISAQKYNEYLSEK